MTIGLTWRRTARRIKRLKEAVLSITPDYSIARPPTFWRSPQYAAEPRDGTEVRQFARKFQSSTGNKDGLYWPADSAKGEEPSPTGPEIKDSKAPYAGYYFK